MTLQEATENPFEIDWDKALLDLEERRDGATTYVSFIRGSYETSYRICSIAETEADAYQKFKADVIPFVEARHNDAYELCLIATTTVPAELKRLETFIGIDVTLQNPDDLEFLAGLLEDTGSYLENMNVQDIIYDVVDFVSNETGEDYEECYARFAEDDKAFDEALKKLLATDYLGQAMIDIVWNDTWNTLDKLNEDISGVDMKPKAPYMLRDDGAIFSVSTECHPYIWYTDDMDASENLMLLFEPGCGFLRWF